jgi:peptide deformylase
MKLALDPKELKTVAREVMEFDSGLKEILGHARRLCQQHRGGVGLAATQVGVADRWFIMNLSGPQSVPTTRFLVDGLPVRPATVTELVNPVVTSVSYKQVTAEEGCLSFPGIRVRVARPVSVALDYQDKKGRRHTLFAEGFAARVIQHELDHLNGISIVDKQQPQ